MNRLRTLPGPWQKNGWHQSVSITHLLELNMVMTNCLWITVVTNNLACQHLSHMLAHGNESLVKGDTKFCSGLLGSIYARIFNSQMTLPHVNGEFAFILCDDLRI